jgi:hypothetical protein
VATLIGSSTKRPCGIFAASVSAMPSSGGLMKPSAELMQSTGTVKRSSCALGVPGGESGWGAKGSLSLSKLAALAEKAK